MKFITLEEEQQYMRSNSLPLDDNYVIVCIYHTPFSSEQRKKFTMKRKSKLGLPMDKLKPYMTDEEVNKHLSEYGELGFDDIPSWLKNEVKARNLIYEKRMPTEMEQWETVSDAREHRIMNKELTQQDYIAKYRKGKSITLIT